MFYSLKKRTGKKPVDETEDVFGFFGKMPFTDDLLSYHIVNDEIHEFERRLYDTVKILEKGKTQGIGPSIERMPVIQFLFTGKNKNHATTGILFAGRDKLNNSYPFVFFNLIRQAVLINQISITPILAREFFETAINLSKLDWSNQTLENLILSVENLPLSQNGSDKQTLLQAQVDLLSEINADEFWKGIEGYEGERNQALYLSALQALISMIISKRLSKAVSAIKIPISNAAGQLPFVVFLIQILYQCLGNQNEHSKFFWYHGNDYYQASLIFFFRPLSVPGIVPMIDKTARADAVLDMKNTIASLSDPTRQSLNLVRNQNGSLMEALFHWANLLCPD